MGPTMVTLLLVLGLAPSVKRKSGWMRNLIITQASQIISARVSGTFIGSLEWPKFDASQVKYLYLNGIEISEDQTKGIRSDI